MADSAAPSSCRAALISTKADDHPSVPCMMAGGDGEVARKDSRSNGSKRLTISFAIWLASYYLMAVFGGSVAFYRFPRQPTSNPEPYTLLDVGFQLLPEYCPKPFLHLNPQSVVLVLFYLHALFWAFKHRASGRGTLLLTRFFLLSSLVFVTRTSLVGLTALPQPNFGSHCSRAQLSSVTFLQAVREVCGSFPPKACGDLIYSGHVACAFTSLFIFDSMDAFPCTPQILHLPRFLPRLLCYLLGVMSTLSCLLCRSHYTVDVVLGVYFAYFLSVFYLQRAQGVVCGGRLGALIRHLEGGNAENQDLSHHPRPLTPADSSSTFPSRRSLVHPPGCRDNGFSSTSSSSSTSYSGYGAISSSSPIGGCI